MAQLLSGWGCSMRRFIQSSLRWKLWLLLFGTICAILLVLTVLISRVTQNYARRTVIATSENLVYQGAQNLENYLHNIETASLVPYSNSALYQRLSTNNSPIYEMDSYINLALKAIASADPTIHQVHLYVDNQSVSYLVHASTFSKSICETPPAQGKLSLDPQHLSSSYGVSSVKVPQSEMVVSLHRTLYRVPEDTYIGQIDIDLNLTYLDSVMQKLKTHESESVFLLSEDEALIYAPDGQSDLPAQVYSILSDHPGAGSVTQMDGGKSAQLFFCSRIALECGIFYLLKVTPIAALSAGTKQLIGLTWLIAFLILLAASAALFVISAQFTAPISKLAQHMERIGQGDMADPITADRTDEIGRLITQFQSMMDNINELIRQRYQLELSNKNSQLLALQAQLNPHFISNTIQSIGAYALQAGNKEIYTQLAGFGSMMQYCMDFQTSLVPLAQEIQFVENYLYFQKLRFSDRFVYSIQTPPELLQMPVPKMLLQPIVENAFVHGRLQDRTNGFLLLTVHSEDNFFTITVEDNGAGADEASLQKLRKELSDSSAGLHTSDHIGICTGYARVRLYYGDAASICVQNRPRGGFVLMLRLPKKEDPHESIDS
ncbi:MAG: sensor histidine kinase [Faecousia sp.]